MNTYPTCSMLQLYQFTNLSTTLHFPYSQPQTFPRSYYTLSTPTQVFDPKDTKMTNIQQLTSYLMTTLMHLKEIEQLIKVSGQQILSITLMIAVMILSFLVFMRIIKTLQITFLKSLMVNFTQFCFKFFMGLLLLTLFFSLLMVNHLNYHLEILILQERLLTLNKPSPWVFVLLPQSEVWKNRSYSLQVKPALFLTKIPLNKFKIHTH